MRPRVTHHPTHIEILVPYDAWLIDELKRIPSHHRNWEPDRKVWTVFRPYIQDALDVVDRCFPHAEHIFPGGSHTREKTSASLDSDLSLMFLAPDAPDFLITAAYRALSKAWHPDNGGDEEQMKKLNAAMDRLRFRRAA